MKDYVGDRGSPVSHVAAELEGAESALSVSDLAGSYRHPVTSDITRVKRHIETDSNSKAMEYLIAQALRELEFRGSTPKSRRQLAVEDNTYRLIVPFDELQWNGRKVQRREPDQHALLRDPFNPQSGAFSENVRKLGNLDGLRESMREFGWIKQLPAIQDERGVIIVGHRRLAVAKELGIDPVITMIHFGTGDGADADRFRLALASNLDAKPFTPDERKRIAEYLYGEREWVMARIAQALNVSQATVSRDLASMHDEYSRKGIGGKPSKVTPELEQTIREAIDRGESADRAVEAALATEPVVDRATAEAAMQVAEKEEGKTYCTCPHCHNIHERKT